MVVLISRCLDAFEVRVQEPESLQRNAGSAAIGCQGNQRIKSQLCPRVSQNSAILCSVCFTSPVSRRTMLLHCSLASHVHQHYKSSHHANKGNELVFGKKFFYNSTYTCHAIDNAIDNPADFH